MSNIVPVTTPELDAALKQFSGELHVWLQESDKRLVDFDPLKSWQRVTELLAAMERAKKASLS